ncbi:hypothetical protein SAMN06265795_102247 [Noviherbaspirillum humi]|uniref:DUF2116 family Zn-ribbon domain-containing protein n=1 Tax=Noviherbaspirillum humi TaxID=1688639 RepID=A0A239DL20_9BURK|nr:hypothetical protein [Noviherbaspirillum humi]SNS33117.1 hypothetical protein SAMN06265795_102247 [Noviherbaspirillum humi]
MDDATPIDSGALQGTQLPDVMKATASLKPKGACWYCNQPLDSVKRFCNKTCAMDYLTEEEVFRDQSS